MISVDALEAYFDSQDVVLSRTATTGTVDTSVSAVKSAPNLSQASLLAHLTRNRRRVTEYVLSRAARPPVTNGDFLASILSIGELYSAGVFESSLFRLWPYDYRKFNPNSQLPVIDSSAVVPALIELDVLVLSRVQKADALSLAGYVEWEIVFGPIHPFYDSCGRIGRYVSGLVAIWTKSALFVHASRPNYLAAGSSGRQEFLDYLSTLDRLSVA